MKRTWLLVAGAAVVIVAAALLARGGGEPATVEDRAQAISAGLRCPVCQNLSVADSPSRLAGEMRAEVEGQLRAGRTDDEVRAFFVARYGEWVLLEPRSLLPFVIPVAAVALGVGAWLLVVRRRPRAERTEVSDAERRRIDVDLRSLEEGA
ncbi:MAG: cytochrome c-type biogenesis protein [Actinomycetota bacterium]|jgi:cytochrome c-type biogenesis protein CcmH